MVSTEQLTRDLDTAVKRGEIEAVFQPQFDLHTGAVVAVETLARWDHDELGAVPPNDFIPLAENAHLIHRLGRLMIDQALDCLVSLREQGLAVEVSVNVSAVQLETLEFYDLLERDLSQHALADGALVIEITESLPILEVPSIVSRLEELRHRGLGIAIDDYGTGHSSLRQLERVPATELKLDQSLVRDSSTEVIDLMRAVIELAHFRGIRVVAEGIETHEQLGRMKELGCDRGQGFLLAMPLSRDELESLLRG